MGFLGTKQQVCRKFFCKILKINKNRVEILQSKIVSNQSLCDKRGKHENMFKIDGKVCSHLKEMLKEIPSHKSHYRLEQSKLDYFENPELSIRKLFNFFKIIF